MRIPISSATIAVIPVTATVVILVVTVTIIGKCCQPTLTFAILIDGPSRWFGRRGNKVLLRRVEARAFVAVTVLPFRTSFAATVTAVPATTTVVVFVITVTIAAVIFCSARS